MTDISRIVITHAHPDHVRGLAEPIARTGGADVFIHEMEERWLATGRVPRHGRSGALGRAIDHLPLLHEPTRTLLVGDAVFHRRPSARRRWPPTPPPDPRACCVCPATCTPSDSPTDNR
ncbi:MBL fold metallo-hydrolase [Streptomyces misionensis]|uniref:MBL fold metallo-hydrolase n=1 Tax=Streptomyces misionensis TaxID=67331 RepID=UPI0033E3C3D7